MGERALSQPLRAEIKLEQHSLKERGKEEERDHYQQLYTAVGGLKNSSLLERCLDASERCFLENLRRLCPGARVLEVGCGTGETAILAAQFGAAEVVGIDISSAAVEKARNQSKAAGVNNIVSFQESDVEKFPYPEEHFDLVIDREAFSSFDLSSVAPLLRRSLKPAGSIVGVECLGHNSLFNLNRTIGALRGKRTRWARDHILRLGQLEWLKELFPGLTWEFFHLSIILAAPLLGRLPQGVAQRVVPYLERFDAQLLSYKRISPLAFRVVFYLRKG
jgi:SAM-dependent methyltransferase